MQPHLSASTTSAGLCAILLVLSGCNKETVAEAAQITPPAPVVEVVEVAAREASGAIRASGLVSYKRETALGFGAPGEIEMLAVDEGDSVRAGQVIASLRKTTVGADAEEALIARQTAEQNFERISRLHASGAASQVDLDNARLALERTRARVELVAPASGVVLRREAERGQMVSAGQPVLWVGEARTGLIVAASVPSADVARVAVGDPVEVEIRDRGAFKGRVARIAAKSSDFGAFEIEVEIDEPQGLRSGEVAEVLMKGRTDGKESLARYVVPAISLIDARADQGAVFIVDEAGRARRRSVETGGVSDEGVVILKGLVEGDRVITRGASMVRDGDPVEVAAG